MADFDDDDDEPKIPTVTIAFEYIEAEETFNFYIRRVSHAPYTPSLCPKYSKAVMYLVKGLTRKTWMGRKRSISWEHRLPSDETPTGWSFAKKLVFDLLRIDVYSALIVCQLVQRIDGQKRVIGQCEVTNDCGQWARMLKSPREPSSETYRLRPAV
ncbi:hypothetical protein GCK32_009739 [Trichostrongylus colubriformis]|uniref:Uncharacterized protein n=1 Tax=Trichostrongylus colubriformis TaxID=6319 RepID=A0AAN8FZU3_TRICO